MKHTQVLESSSPDCFYLLKNNQDCNFTIVSHSTFLPHDGVFAVIATDELNKNNLFRALMERSYDFDSADRLSGKSLLEGYCIYNIGFAEAIILGEMASCESIFYRHLEKVGIYATDTKEVLQEIFFEE
jgi:hypothetical protein